MTHHSRKDLWTRDGPVAETCIWQHTVLTKEKYLCPWRIFFFLLFILLYYVLHLYSPSWLPCILPFCLYLQHKPNIHAPAGFFWLFLCTLFVVLCPDCPAFCLLSVLYNTHNTNIQASGRNQTRNPSKRAAQTYTLDRAANGIRTRNPSKRSAADPRHGPLGQNLLDESNRI
jgi:hypothetical protein